MQRLPILFLLTALYLNTPAQTSGKAVNVSADSVTFAVIGDFGRDTRQEDSVARLIDSWQVDFIMTVGDNNYPEGSAATIDRKSTRLNSSH